MSKDWTGGTASVFKTIGANDHAEPASQKERGYTRQLNLFL